MSERGPHLHGLPHAGQILGQLEPIIGSLTKLAKDRLIAGQLGDPQRHQVSMDMSAFLGAIGDSLGASLANAASDPTSSKSSHAPPSAAGDRPVADGDPSREP
ncbi:MAG: hypothetical protein ABSD74_06265 [Rhizomicrobium sp.]